MARAAKESRRLVRAPHKYREERLIAMGRELKRRRDSQAPG